MAAAPRMKLADKQEIYKKVLSSLKKRYPSVSKLPELPVLETMLFAVCLENATVADADVAFKRLTSSFHDLNEVRVSSIEELEAVFHGMSTPDWRAMRIRGILGHVFESTYSFEFDGLKRKTLELATKQLAKIKELTPFVRDFTLHASLGAHVIPLDDVLLHAIEFLDLHADSGGLEATAESLRPLVRKADGSEFSSLLREFATDPKLRPTISTVRQAVVDGAVLPTGLVRFEKVLKGEQIKFDPPPKKSAEKKEAERKEAERKDLEKREHEKKEKGGAKTDVAKPEVMKAETTKSDSGKKADATKVEHARPESSKAEAAKSENSKGKSSGGKAEAAKPEPSKMEGAKADQTHTEHGKGVAGKSAAAKPEKKADVINADKPVKVAAAKPTSKSTKPETAKVETTKTAVASGTSAKAESRKPELHKSESQKSKAPAAGVKKEPVTAVKKEDTAAVKPNTNSKTATKAVAAAAPPTKANSAKVATKPVVEAKASKKPTSKSGK